MKKKQICVFVLSTKNIMDGSCEHEVLKNSTENETYTQKGRVEISGAHE